MSFDIDEYQFEIAEIRFGKRVGTSLYFHEECTPRLPPGVQRLAEQAQSAANLSKFSFNVYKLDIRTPIVSLLHYPDFFDEGFPTLSESASWEVGSASLNIRAYSNFENRPILHRKELLLPPGHERIDQFAGLTEVAEQLGLFDDRSRIGRYGYWTSLLSKKDVTVVGHTLKGQDGNPIELRETDQSIQRYRTALKRNRLSVPVQLMLSNGLLDEESEIFDYGCGRGDDVTQLKALGIKASGWDPHFCPDEPKNDADVVNLGYVVNVIEDLSERASVIADAFDLARGILVVSALVGSPNYSKSAQRFKDGYITSSGTFQKYFQPQELADLIERSTGAEPIALARGTLAVFKREDLEQEFLALRLSRRRQARVRVHITELAQLNEDAQSQADRYWEKCIELARPATRAEAQDCDELFKYVPSARKVHELVRKERKGQRFEEARQQRSDELLIEFALANFGKPMFFKYFPDTLKKDVEYHFGRYSNLQNRSKELLYAIADIESLLGACVDASDGGVGYLLDDHSLQLHIDLVPKLAPILQVYVGCAGVLYGDWAQVDLVKIHIHSGKVSFMGYDDFEGRPVPDLIERVKVKMWEREVDFFDYVGEFTPPPLFLKSLYIDESFDIYDEQSAFDRELMRTQLFDFMRDRVTRSQFYGALDQSGYRIKGYELAKTA